MWKNLKVLNKLLFLIGVMAIALIINACMGFYGFSLGLKGIHEAYSGNTIEIQKLDSIDDLNLLAILETAYQVRDGRVSSEQGLAKIKNVNTHIDKLWQEYFELSEKNHNRDLHGKAQLIQVLVQDREKMKKAIDRLEEILQQNDTNLLDDFIIKELSPAQTQRAQDIRKLIAWHTADAKADYERIHNKISNLETATLVTLLLSLLAACAIAIAIALSITNPLKKSVEVMQKMTVGDMDFEIKDTTNDEVGHLLTAMQKMALSSQKMSDLLTCVSKGDLSQNISLRSEKDSLGSALIKMVTTLKQIVGEIQSEVSSLTESSQEIVTSVSQVAAGSAETAAAVTETTTSLEELKQTAHLSDEKAKDVLASAEETLSIVNESERSLQSTIEDMKQINDKMRSISEGIVKLSEHSQTIGEIIDSVNDLAEQSNLLAVNAAIEAAKAGEHGKSFSVVAQEIRMLAEQSKAATVQVRGILNDIQNATSAAVLATEQGSKAVEKGVKQSAQTNESMQTLSKSIQKMTQAANQIAISSQQQFVGIDQASEAMISINDAASEHVQHMKQIQSSVISLNSVGEALKEISNQYFLSKQENFDTFRKQEFSEPNFGMKRDFEKRKKTDISKEFIG